jgi:predicted nucleic acid-binding protein
VDGDTHPAYHLKQNGVTRLYTADRDFRRFDFLKVIDPTG